MSNVFPILIEELLYIGSSFFHVICIYKHYSNESNTNGLSKMLHGIVYFSLTSFLLTSVSYIFHHQQLFCQYALVIGETFYSFGLFSVVIYQITRFCVISYNNKYCSWCWRIYITVITVIGLLLLIFYISCLWLATIYNLPVVRIDLNCVVRFQSNAFLYRLISWHVITIYFVWDFAVILVFIWYLHKLSNDSNQEQVKYIMKNIVFCAVIYQTMITLTTFVMIYADINTLYHILQSINVTFASFIQYTMHYGVSRRYMYIIGQSMCCSLNESSINLEETNGNDNINQSTCITLSPSTTQLSSNVPTLYSHLQSHQQIQKGEPDTVIDMIVYNHLCL
eukprot:429605_1